MSTSEFTGFLAKVFANLAGHSVDGDQLHRMDWRHMSEVLAAAAPAYTELKNLCVWSKTDGGMGSLYRSQHELVFFKLGTAAHIDKVKLSKNGRYRTNVWTYAGERTGRRGYGIELDPLHCDVIIRRLAKVAGVEAIHAETGKSFDAMAA